MKRASMTSGGVCILTFAWVLASPACSSNNSPSPGMGAPDSSAGADTYSGGGGDDSSSVSDAPASGDAKTSKPKDIGSSCTATAECAMGLMCDMSFPNGICTLACQMDSQCVGRRIMGICVNSLCFAPCTPTAPVTDAGADAAPPKSPCKNSTFECVSVPNETSMVCLPNPEAGAGEGGPGGDAEVPDSTTGTPEAGGMDAAEGG